MPRLHRHILPGLLIATACGGRSAITDVTDSDDDGVEASGGKQTSTGSSSSGERPAGGGPAFPSGGFASGGFASGGFASGGFASGGASAGGTSSGGQAAGGVSSGGASSGGVSSGGTGSGGTSSCESGSWADGDECRPWSVCEPGEYLVYFGTGTEDTVCKSCPAEGFTNAPNQTSCAYSGCAFSELVIEPATPQSAATCAPDPDYYPLNNSAFGLQALGTTLYVGLLEEQNFSVYRFAAGALTDPITFAGHSYEPPRGFALAPDGRVYVHGVENNGTVVPWIDSRTSDPASLWQGTLADVGYSTNASGLITTDSHWISWQLPYGEVDYDLKIYSSPHPDFAPTLIAEFKAIYATYAVGADDQERLWVIAADDSQLSLFRSEGAGAELELVPLPSSFIPLSLAVTPAGLVYVLSGIAEDNHRFDVLELDASGNVQRSFTYEGVHEEIETLIPFGIAVTPGQAVFVTLHQIRNGSDYYFSRTNLMAVRFDLVTSSQQAKMFGGPNYEQLQHLAATSDGSAYMTGWTSYQWFLRKIF